MSEEGRNTLARAKTRSFLNCKEGKFWAAGKAIGFIELDEVQALSEQLDCFSNAPREPVNWYWKRKGASGGRRPICILSPRAMAENYLVKLALEAQFIAPSFMFGIKGRGRDDEARQIAEAIQDGFRWSVTADIRECFQSVCEEELYQKLPVPRAVIENCLDTRRMEFHHIEGDVQGNVSRRDGPRGLIQGSPVSNVVLAFLLSEIGDVIAPHDCRAFLFCDNLIVTSKDEMTVRMIDALVQEHFSGHQAGPFHLHSQECRSIAEGWEQIGYQFSVTENRVSIEPTHAAFERIYGRLANAYVEAELQASLEPLEIALANSISGYDAWTEKTSFEEEVRYGYPMLNEFAEPEEATSNGQRR